VVWSADGQQLAVCGRGGKPTGLWIYDRRTNEGRKLIKGPVGTLSGWSPDGSRFELGVGFPYVEIWVIDISEGSSLQEVLGPGITVQEHGQVLIDYYDKAIEADPEFTELYLLRAEQALWLYGEKGASVYMQDFELALSRCDFYLFGLLWHIWSRHCWPPFGRCRTLSPLSILMAEKIVEKKPSWIGNLALAHYRAGHWDKTIELMCPVAERPGAGGIGCFLMAMACWQLGQKEEAPTWYAKGMEWMDSHKPPVGAFWLQGEATVLLGMPETQIMEMRRNE
jgi:hypothetical protein